jgi:ABC-type transporter Mla maintaining outer membrane lipid asymmetry ATPase subunit MlaF
VTAPLLELEGVSKDYRGLRPLRVERLAVRPAERVALLGFDRPMAEVFVNLATGTTLPDRGEVRVFGRPTSAIVESTEWLALVDRFGIVSERAVLLDSFTVRQNLAVPFTLDIEPPPPDVADLAAGLAREVGLPEGDWSKSVASVDPGARIRVRLGRALALDPSLVLLEHASAGLPETDAAALAACLRQICERRGAAMVALTADRAFARASADRLLTLDAATGRLSDARRRWFGLRGG